MNYENMHMLKQRLGIYNAGALLDVAVGRGDFLKFALASFHSWNSAVGIDIDPDMLGQAIITFQNTPVVLLHGSALSMPFTNHYFDTVTMSNALHHIENLQSLFDESARVCKSHGLLFINEMINESASDIQETYMLYHRFIADIDNQQGRYHRETYTLKELLSIIKSNGFQLMDYFIHEEVTGNIMNSADIETLSDRLRKKVASLKGTDYYYFYSNKAEDIINRFKKTGIHQPRHVTFIMQEL
jgi:ubiquinone/menaquinone biosynthesis C-methylase UbiE